MARELTLDLSDAAFNRLTSLQHSLKEPNPEALIFRALGLIQVILEYVDQDGVLTVVDPKLAAENADDPNVELEFESLRPAPAEHNFRHVAE